MDIRRGARLVQLIVILNVVAIGLDLPLLRPFLGLALLFVVPGLLIAFLLDIRGGDFWEYCLLVPGLSIAFLMLAGLLLNQGFLALGLSRPLGPGPVLFVLAAIGLAGPELALRLDRRDWAALPVTSGLRRGWRHYLLPALFPIVSAYGALLLNAGFGGQVAAAAVVVMAVYALYVVWQQDQVPSHILPYSLLMIGLAMLLSFSLRSWHISGWDINQEYHVFRLADASGAWSMEQFRDPYNACLSITILPTVVNAILGIRAEYVFKLVYPLIFALVPLGIFLTARKYFSPLLSYLSGLFFIFQPWFIQPLPALARQEIALLFFALFLWAVFHPGIASRRRSALLVVFGGALIVSHYSTAYVGLGMLTITYCAARLFRLAAGPRLWWRAGRIPGWVLLLLYGLTFLWSSLLTQTSGNVLYVARLTLENMRTALLSDLRSEDLRLALGFGNERFDLKDVQAYVDAQNALHAERPGRYPDDAYRSFTPEVVRSAELPGLIAGHPAQPYASALFLAIRQLTKALLILGAVVLLRHVLRSRGFDHEYALLNLISLGVLFLFMALPILSLYYNLFRIFIQTLVVSSPSLIIGANLLLTPFSQPRWRARIIALVLVAFFVSSSGLAAYIVGGPATMNLNNSGEDYDKFYTREQEVLAADWLAINRDPAAGVYADRTAALRLISFGHGLLQVDTAVLPSTLTRDGYVYLDYANAQLGIAQAEHSGKQISYAYPLEFLDLNKSLIYDNGGARIYR